MFNDINIHIHDLKVDLIGENNVISIYTLSTINSQKISFFFI